MSILVDQAANVVRSFAVHEGSLGIGGIPLPLLVARVGGTPFFAYSRSLITRRIAELREAFPPTVRLSYAIKANPMPAVVQHIASLVDGLDVASAGELKIALDTETEASRISFAGPGKRPHEIARALAAGVVINLESETELRLVVKTGEELGVVPKVVVRVNPDFELRASGMHMGGGSKPFGIDAERVPRVLAELQTLQVSFEGFQVFWGTQNLNAEAICEAQRRTIDMIVRLGSACQEPIRIANIGGGFGIPYFAGEKALNLKRVGVGLREIGALLEEAMPGAMLVIELGRYIVGEAGIYVCRVVDRKQSRGKTFLITDGGLHQHLAASGNFGQVVRRNYPVAIGNRMRDEPTETFDVVGCLCTPIDVLARDVQLPPTAVGDLVVVFQSGAYARTASPTAFLSHPEPVEVLV